MRFHCVGPGSIGSLVCFHIRKHTTNEVRLHVRRRQRQHREAFPTTRDAPHPAPSGLSIQLESDAQDGAFATDTASPFEIEYVSQPSQDPIEALLVTTKAQHVVRSISRLLPRLSALSTVVLLHNGLGVMEDLMSECFPDASLRPSFVLAHTSHGVHRKDEGDIDGCHGRFVHAGVGDLPFAVLPSLAVQTALQELAKRNWHWPTGSTEASRSSSLWGRKRAHDSLVEDVASSFRLTPHDNPLLDPDLDTVVPSVAEHLPYLPPHTATLHTTISTLLSPPIQSRLGTRWIPLPTYRMQSLAKLAVNCAANPLTGVIECRNGLLEQSAYAQGIIRGVAGEATEVFAALLEEQASSSNTDGPVQYTPSASSLERRRRRPTPLLSGHPLSFQSLMSRVNQVIKATGSNISSTLADVMKIPAESARQRGASQHTRERAKGGESPRQSPPAPPIADLTEVDHLNGYLCRVGRQLGVPTPVNDTLVDLIRLKCEHVWLRQAPRLVRYRRRQVGSQ